MYWHRVLGEFKSVARIADIPGDVMALYKDGTEDEDALVFPPSNSS